jgi:hypothetical protein
MVTSFPDDLAAPVMVAAPAGETARSLLARAVDALQQMICGLHGHHNLLQFGRNRVCLRCSSCGHETPGWEIGNTRPRLRFPGDPRRQVLVVRHRLVDTRKIA